jgi:hypothetical protein
MTETVRIVSDGEELVLSQGEAFGFHWEADPREPSLDRRSESVGAITGGGGPS